MKKMKYLLWISAALPCWLAAAHIGFMMPAGGQRGSTVDVIIGGQAFWNVDKAWISGKGVSIEKVQFVRGIPHPDGRQRRWMNATLRNFHKGKLEEAPKPETTEGWRTHPFFDRLLTLSDCERDILYRFLFVPYNSLQASPAIAGRAIVTFKIAPDAPLGEREFRLIARNGILSNPLKFFVGKVPEFREDFFPFPPAVKSTPLISIPGVINGQITPGETDYFKFKASRGEVLTFQLLGRYFNPFIGDGVPGHFQAVLEIVDRSGKVVGYADDHFFDPDPVLEFTAPSDGEYTLRIRDALYRGREDFVYRINVFKGKLPFVMPAPPEMPGVKKVDAAKIRDGKVTLPSMISDTFRTPEGNRYQISLKKGEKVVAEIFARRIGLPPDAVLKISDRNGRIVAHNDDIPRLKAGVILHNSADPCIVFTAPEDGTYQIHALDVARAYGEAWRYYLRIDRPRQWFKVYSVPSAAALIAGSCNRLRLTVERFDGFAGEIKLKIKNPAGYRIVGSNVIPAGCDSTVITISADYDAKRTVRDLEIEAYCGDFKTRVIPGDEGTQAFAYTHINPAKYFSVLTLRKGQRLLWDLKTSHLQLKNSPTVIKVKNPGSYFPAGVEISIVPVDIPEWLTVVPDAKSKGKTVLVKLPKKRQKISFPALQISLRAKENAAGRSANVLFKAQWQVKGKPDKKGKIRYYRQELLLPALQISVPCKEDMKNGK